MTIFGSITKLGSVKSNYKSNQITSSASSNQLAIAGNETAKEAHLFRLEVVFHALLGLLLGIHANAEILK
ncbi:hypothetical protein CYY_001214 [Polysphondylium violaceum]|uniref:Uncharacterized protein n=1 Tax=Polysphondylium violaceum TaxID=133409 RepID=A0A8J4Q2G4_9MYCE|nr:hypothetical protein CYY_001214 [Polysphondylium violaceum]